MKGELYLDKQKLFVLVSTLILLTSFVWFEASGQELIEEVMGIEPEEPQAPLEEKPIQELPLEIIEESNNTSASIIEDNIQPSSDNEEELVPYVLYAEGKKEIETEIEEGREISILKEERVSDTPAAWEKEIKVYSEEHFERSLTVYSDIIETEDVERVELYWINENEEVTDDPTFELTFYDTNSNGRYDRVSFEVPHLSEQSFEIRIFYTTYHAENLTLDVISSPGPVVLNNQSMTFNFSVGYSNISAVFCDLELKRGTTLAYSQSGFITSQFNVNSSSLANGNYQWELYCSDYYQPIFNASESGIFELLINYSARISFSSNTNNIEAGQTVTFYVNATTPDNREIFYTLFFGEGTPIGPSPTHNINAAFPHTYNSANSYTASLIIVDGSSSPHTINLPITVTSQANSNSNSQTNNGAVEISLLAPSNNAILHNEPINFSYSARSNVSIANCTYNIYHFNGSSNLGLLVYSEVNSSIRANATDIVVLSQFDEGDYSWEVECYDSERKYGSRDRDFTFDALSGLNQISLSDANATYERKEDIEALISDIDNFLEESDTYGLEEKDAIEILGISEEILAYKRKLNQFKQDLRHNINFIQDDDDRRERKRDIFAQLDEMEEKVPRSLSVVKSEEYVKNSIDSDMEEIVSTYAEAENMVLSGREVRRLSLYNKDLQSSVSVSAKARHVSIEYNAGRSELTLVTKSIESDTQEKQYLEAIPEDLSDEYEGAVILNEHTYVKNNTLFSVMHGGLIDGKIVYYLDSFVPFNSLKDADTLIFSEEIDAKGGMLTGFSILGGMGSLSSLMIYMSWAVFAILLIGGGFMAARNFSYGKYRNTDEVRAVLGIISESKRSLAGKDIVLAKRNYERVKEIYRTLSIECKNVVYGPIQSLLLEIDRIEATSLIQECIDSLRDGRKDDAARIYERIKALYTRMPQKFKEKIRSKILPYIYLFNK